MKNKEKKVVELSETVAVDWDKVCLICGFEKRKDELCNFFGGRKWRVCKVCDKLDHKAQVLGVMNTMKSSDMPKDMRRKLTKWAKRIARRMGLAS